MASDAQQSIAHLKANVVPSKKVKTEKQATTSYEAKGFGPWFVTSDKIVQLFGKKTYQACYENGSVDAQDAICYQENGTALVHPHTGALVRDPSPTHKSRDGTPLPQRTLFWLGWCVDNGKQPRQFYAATFDYLDRHMQNSSYTMHDIFAVRNFDAVTNAPIMSDSYCWACYENDPTICDRKFDNIDEMLHYFRDTPSGDYLNTRDSDPEKTTQVLRPFVTPIGSVTRKSAPSTKTVAVAAAAVAPEEEDDELILNPSSTRKKEEKAEMSEEPTPMPVRRRSTHTAPVPDKFAREHLPATGHKDLSKVPAQNPNAGKADKKRPTPAEPEETKPVKKSKPAAMVDPELEDDAEPEPTPVAAEAPPKRRKIKNENVKQEVVVPPAPKTPTPASPAPAPSAPKKRKSAPAHAPEPEPKRAQPEVRYMPDVLSQFSKIFDKFVQSHPKQVATWKTGKVDDSAFSLQFLDREAAEIDEIVDLLHVLIRLNKEHGQVTIEKPSISHDPSGRFDGLVHQLEAFRGVATIDDMATMQRITAELSDVLAQNSQWFSKKCEQQLTDNSSLVDELSASAWAIRIHNTPALALQVDRAYQRFLPNGVQKFLNENKNKGNTLATMYFTLDTPDDGLLDLNATEF